MIRLGLAGEEGGGDDIAVSEVSSVGGACPGLSLGVAVESFPFD